MQTINSRKMLSKMIQELRTEYWKVWSFQMDLCQNSVYDGRPALCTPFTKPFLKKSHRFGVEDVSGFSFNMFWRLLRTEMNLWWINVCLSFCLFVCLLSGPWPGRADVADCGGRAYRYCKQGGSGCWSKFTCSCLDLEKENETWSENACRPSLDAHCLLRMFILNSVKF